MTSAANLSHPRLTVSPPLWTDLVIVGAATICALVAWLTTRLSGVDLTVQVGGGLQHVTGLSVAITAIVASALGLVTLRIMERLMQRPLKWWTILVVAVTLVSAMGPLGATNLAAMGALIGLHAVVAAVVLVAAWRSHRAWTPKARAQ